MSHYPKQIAVDQRIKRGRQRYLELTTVIWAQHPHWPAVAFVHAYRFASPQQRRNWHYIVARLRLLGQAAWLIPRAGYAVPHNQPRWIRTIHADEQRRTRLGAIRAGRMPASPGVNAHARTVQELRTPQ